MTDYSTLPIGTPVTYPECWMVRDAKGGIYEVSLSDLPAMRTPEYWDADCPDEAPHIVTHLPEVIK